MDDLSYVYTGNKLSTVQDDIAGNHEVDFVPRGKGTYTYLANGNLLSDENKEITGIVYNTFLNKPSQINLSGNRWIKLNYAGTGSLIKKEYSTGEYWEYAPEILYKNGLLHQLAYDEGRILKNNGVFEYEFNYKDHLGNSRVSFKAEGQNLVTTDITDFDSWGITLNGLGQTNAKEDRFKMQNKESLTLFGLENYVDFGARYLDKSIGRWTATDPLGSKWHMVSPYVNTMNNSIRYLDPDGREIIFILRDERGLVRNYRYSNGNFYNIATKGKYIKGNETLDKLLTSYRKIENSKDNVLKKQLHTLETSKNIHYIQKTNKTNTTESEHIFGSRLYLNLSAEMKEKLGSSNNSKETDLTIVSHEMRHQYEHDKGIGKDNLRYENSYRDPSEIRAVWNSNRARKIEGDKNLRKMYGGFEIDPKLLNNPPNNNTDEN